MQKTVTAMKARGQLGQILEEVYYRGSEVIIERAGKPMAVVVPVAQYEQWRKDREDFFNTIDMVRESSTNVPISQVEADVAAARRASRKHK